MHSLSVACLFAASLAATSAGAQSPLAIDPAGSDLAWGPCPAGFDGDCKIAVLHGAPDKPNADVVLKVAPGFIFPAHSHTSAERMILLQGKMRVQYRGSDPIVLERGNYAYGPAGLVHDAACQSAEPCMLFIAFEGPVDAILEPRPGQ